ncbi:MAG: energy transducer TonB [Thermodesulfobacteriota bacterium]|nr:energy transducer TonB [Thermodesulfobacteriota bacterium]
MISKPNWLLRNLVGISLGIHFVIFMHITGLYRSQVLTCIELTLKSTSESSQRSIPRPRHRVAPPEPFQEIKRQVIKTVPIPRPIKVEPSESYLPDALTEVLGCPEIPEDRRSETDSVSMEPAADNYMETIRLRIERFKKYPHFARTKHMEGMATLRFTITKEGRLKESKLVKTTRYRILDRAALEAVRNAAPFPPLPESISASEITLEIAIVFELT